MVQQSKTNHNKVSQYEVTMQKFWKKFKADKNKAIYIREHTDILYRMRTSKLIIAAQKINLSNTVNIRRKITY